MAYAAGERQGGGESLLLRVRRADANQKEVTKALRKIGAAVTPIHVIGKGVADLLVSFRNQWFVLEVKDGTKPPSQRTLTQDEQDWIAEQKALVAIINSPEEAVRLVSA